MRRLELTPVGGNSGAITSDVILAVTGDNGHREHRADHKRGLF